MASSHSAASLHFLIDGNRCPSNLPAGSEAVAIVGGDNSEYVIALSSILAKVTRDRLMREHDVEYPEYGLARHKGYGTAAHRAMIEKIGGSPIHRKSFAPWKTILESRRQKGKVKRK
uniref:Ribonuclease n=1 Tax=Corethron hystrix TaxID=216773 RepID=A0A7S1BCV1_9STRA